MANFNSFKITDSGLDLQYKAQIGKTLEFSKFVLGDGYYTGSIRELNQLVNPIREEPITRLTVVGTGTTKKLVIGFDLETKNINTGFYLREIGIYAKDPDTNEDVLMFYTNAGETADYIASNASDNVTAKLINGELYLSDIEEITAVINSSLVYATQSDIESINNTIQQLTTTVNNIEIPTKVSDLQNDAKYATEDQVDEKVSKEAGKGLSTNDYSNDDKNKLDNLPTNPLTSETDPTVPSWAKQATKPSYTFSEIQNKPDTYTPSAHTHAASQITAGTLAGGIVANATAVTTLGTAQIRNIKASTTDLTAGSSALTTGDIYVTYE